MKAKFRKLIFWDTNPNKIDYKKNSSYIIKKVLNFGNVVDFKNLTKTYTNKLIKETLINSRGISPKSANFWAVIFNINPQEIKCLKKSYQKTHVKFWSH